ncbi:unnamed protein product [marine sediment metagenome]|uniref:Uncharacterized protein n=1 Tax=marine sediment metagenome TaxID=412755 RepID=X0YDX7_9ZZZZ
MEILKVVAIICFILFLFILYKIATDRNAGNLKKIINKNSFTKSTFTMMVCLIAIYIFILIATVVVRYFPEW